MGQVIVITGCGEGMGREVAKLLASSGDTIAGFDVDEKSISSLANELRGGPGEHLLMPLDIKDRQGILAFKDAVIEKYGRVDTVLSNVGIGFFGPFEEIDLDKALACFEINVIGAAAIFQAFIPSLRAQGSGKLVAMSSLVGRIPFPFESIYTATKFAIEGMMLAMRLEVMPFGIHCAIIEPAQVSTTFAAKIHKLPPEGSPYRERARRFIAKDNVMIKTAPTPIQAARRIVKVLKAEKPPLFSQIDAQSTFFLALNRWLPVRARDIILESVMDIRV